MQHFGLSIQQIQAPENVAPRVVQTAPAPAPAPATASPNQADSDQDRAQVQAEQISDANVNNTVTTPTPTALIFNVPSVSFFMQTWRRVWANPQSRFCELRCTTIFI